MFTEHYRQPVSELSAVAYVEGLSDLTAQQLDSACGACLRACRFMPTVADIRAQISQADAAGQQLEWDKTWERLLDWVRRYFDPNLGVDRRAPPLPAAVEHAAMAAGGCRWLESCPEPELQWAKKRFIQALANVDQAQASKQLLTRGEANRILGELTARAAENNTRLLATPPDASSDSRPAGDPTALAEFVEGMRKVAAIPTKEDWEARKREQLARLGAHVREHPEFSSAKAETHDLPS